MGQQPEQSSDPPARVERATGFLPERDGRRALVPGGSALTAALRFRPSSREATAYHEAGHAAIGVRLGRPVRFAALAPADRPDVDGIVVTRKRGPREAANWADSLVPGGNPAAVARVLADLQVTVAGPLAEEMVTGRRNNAGARSDYDQIDLVALNVSRTREEARLLCRWLMERTRNELLTIPVWAAVRGIAAGLLGSGRLAGKELRALYYAAASDLTQQEQAELDLRRRGFASRIHFDLPD